MQVLREFCKLDTFVNGEGEPVFLIHGFPLTHEMWEPQIKVLIENGFKVIAPDMRGFGNSLVNISEWTMDDFANDVICIANKLNINKFSVAGMSMGGYIAFNLIDQYPERIKSAILISTKAQADDEQGKARRNQLIELAKTRGKTPVIEEFKKILFAPLTWEKNLDLISRVSVIMERASLNGIVGSLGAMRDRKDYVDLLPKIEFPVLIIHGRSDLASPVENANLMAAGIRNSKTFYSDISGHMVNLEDAENVNSAILEFLKETR